MGVVTNIKQLAAFTKAQLIAKISDVTEIFTNNSSEISSLTEKASPIGDDLLLLEDSADSNSKKKVKVSSVGGSGDVTGPGSSTDNAVARYDGSTGKVLQNSAASVDDSGVLNSTKISTTGPTVAASVIAHLLANVDSISEILMERLYTRTGIESDGPTLMLKHLRKDANSTLQDGDEVGRIRFQGATKTSGYAQPYGDILVEVEDGGDAISDGVMLFKVSSLISTNYTVPAPMTFYPVERLRIEPDGTLSVQNTVDYEDLVTLDDDIPNKKYVDSRTQYRLDMYLSNLDDASVAEHEVAGLFEAELSGQAVSSGVSKNHTNAGRAHVVLNLTTITTPGTLTLTGTSFDPTDGSTTGSDTENIVIGAGNTGYYKSSKYWQGTVVISTTDASVVLDSYRYESWYLPGKVDLTLAQVFARASSATNSVRFLVRKLDFDNRTLTTIYDETTSNISTTKNAMTQRKWAAAAATIDPANNEKLVVSIFTLRIQFARFILTTTAS